MPKKKRAVLSIYVFACLFVFGEAPNHAVAGLTTFETNDFSGSGVCAFCHSRLRDEAGNDVSNDAHWRSTMMANSSKDPFWQAKISAEVELQTSDAIKQVIQEKCSRCHMGMARYQQLANGDTKADIHVLDGGYLDPSHYLHEAAMDGVSCTLCHQIQPGNLGTQESFTGQYEIDTTTASTDRALFGPYADPTRNPMHRNTGFRPTDHAPDFQLASSSHCGSCHTLYTPALDADGNYLKEFPEQTTYLEWRHSRFNQTCQDCHLPDADGPVVVSNRPRRLAARNAFGQHHFVGGNSFMVNLVKANAADLGVTATAAHLDATISRTLAQLQQKTAAVTAVTELSGGGDELSVTVDVTNLAGHKFPSGLPSRRAWLHITVVDSVDRIIFESGRPLADGSIQGNDADMGQGAYEHHYDRITAADQVQIYEPVMLNSDGEVTYTLLRAYAYVKDNRLLPAGFDRQTADADIGVYGVDEDENFTGGLDRIEYVVDVSAASGELTVMVELLFQSISYPFVEDLRETGTDPVHRFLQQFDKENNAPVVVAATQVAVGDS